MASSALDGNDYTKTHEEMSGYNQNAFEAEQADMGFNKSLSVSKMKRSAADALDILRTLPEVRPIPWLPGKELPPEKSTESPRKQTQGAFLLSTRGIIRSPPCTHCATGVGRFLYCVSLDGWFQGACATCQMATRGNRCSLRKEVIEGRSQQEGHSNPELLLSPHLGNREVQKSVKRKRESLIAQTPGSRPHPPLTYKSPLHDNYEGTPYETASTPPQNQDGTNPLLKYVYHKMNPASGNQRHHFVPHAQEDGNNQEPINRNVRIAKMGNSTGVPDASTLLSPSAQLLSSVCQMSAQSPQQRHQSFSGQGRVYEEEAAIFDTFPRKKQKQIFAIIGGIQSGIRSAKQQVESLQKQLDLLQTALGMESEEKRDDI